MNHWSKSVHVFDRPTLFIREPPQDEPLPIDINLLSGPCPPVPDTPPNANLNANIRAAEELGRAKYTNPVGRYVAFGALLSPKGPHNYKLQGDYQDFGNFNFGAMGIAAGFSPDQLVRLAGYYQEDQQTARGTSAGFWGSLWGTGGAVPYGDAWRDHHHVVQGMLYYIRMHVLKNCP